MTNLTDAMGEQFDSEKVEPAAPFEVLPAGWYTAEIDETSINPASTGGEYLKIRFSLLTEPFTGRKAWDNLNIVHKTPKAQNIARANLSAICRAIGVLKPADSSELHFKPLQIKLEVEDKGRGPQNVVKGYRATEGAPCPDGTVGVPQDDLAIPTSTPAKPVAPWGRKRS